MAQKILIKKSGVLGVTPTTAQLDFGELAVNYRDNKLFFKVTDGAGTGATESIVAVEFNSNGAYAKSFTLNGNNLEITDASGNNIDTIDLGAVVPNDLSLYQLRSEKGQANGYASLDSNGKVPSSELPAIAITDVSVVNTIIERDALTVQEGDVAIVTNNIVDPSANGTYIYDGSAWQLVQSPGGTVTSVNGQTGVVQLDAVNIPYSNLTSLMSATTTQAAIDELDGRLDTAETQLTANTTLLGLLDTAVNDPSTGLLVTVQGLTTDVGNLQVDVGALETTIGLGGTGSAANSFIGTDSSGNFIYVAQGAVGGVLQSDGDGTFSVFDLTGALAGKANVADVLDSADLTGNTLNLRDSGNNIIASVDLSSLDNQTAAEVSFDPSGVSLTGTNVQISIEELSNKVDVLEANGGEANVQSDLAVTDTGSDAFVLNKDIVNLAYDNTNSTLTATTGQAAIDELDGRLVTAEADIDALEAVTSGLTATEFVVTDSNGNLTTVTPGTDEFLKYNGTIFVSTNIVDGGSF